jgi:dihydroxy-acid dehydratase
VISSVPIYIFGFDLILQECALLTDGRFSGGSHGFVVGHICPEAQVNLLFNFISEAIVINDLFQLKLTVEIIKNYKSQSAGRRTYWLDKIR